jgi:hypothetical protein
VSERAGERLRMPVNGAGSALRAPPFEASRANVQAGKFSVHFSLRFAIPRQRHQKWTTFRVSFEFLLDNILLELLLRLSKMSEWSRDGRQQFDFSVAVEPRHQMSKAIVHVHFGGTSRDFPPCQQQHLLLPT